ncbi:MAG: choice-of-anchor D domain-containing protein [Gammaproteobacteria bacterium]|nr:choice-of-anchor D domain-containing protein [Gammaproteobacteria bacterium]
MRAMGLPGWAAALLIWQSFTPAAAVTVNWIGPDDSFWDLAANWSPARPAAADDASLASFNTVFRSGTVALNSFSGSGTLSVTGGILRPAAASSAGRLVLSGSATLAGLGTITADLFDWRGGTLGETGANAGGVTRVTGATTLAAAQLTLQAGRRLELLGPTTWTQGTGAGSSLRMLGSAASGAVLSIGSGASFDDAGEQDPNAHRVLGFLVNASGRIDNAGTYRRSGAAVTDVRAAFDNHGLVEVVAGALELNGGGASDGHFVVAPGARLQFGVNGVTHTLTGATLDNAGELDLFGVNGTLAFDATTRVLGAGVVNLRTGALDSASALQLTTLRIAGSASQTIARLRADTTLDTLDFSNGTLSGSGVVSIGALSWTGGVMGEIGANAGGSATVLGAAVIDAARVDVQAGRRLELRGATTWRQQPGLPSVIAIFGTGANAGVLEIANGAVFDDAGNDSAAVPARALGFTNQGAIANAGTFRRSGFGATDVRSRFDNHGVIEVAGGTLSFVSASSLQGTGTLRLGALGAADLSHGNSSVGTLEHAGAADSLNLGARTLSVVDDYLNAAFGSGNAFDRRAHVVTTGTGNRLLAAGDVNQAVSGDGVSDGATVTPGLVIGNVHVGANTRSYTIENTGTSGPALRGAIQDAVNGGAIDDARLSGNGVSAGAWGPVAAGAGLVRDVVFTGDTAGVYAPLSGQSVNILDNFDNTRSQVLGIGSAAGAAAFNFAEAAAIAPASPVRLANQRVGGTLRATLTIANAAPGGAFTEGLNARFGTPLGDALTNGGSLALLAGGASNGTALAVGVDTAGAGAKQGVVTVDFVSDGTGTSGLGQTPLAAQTVAVRGDVFRLAAASAPAPIVLANRHVGDAASQRLALTNIAPDDGYSERLDARFGTLTGDATVNGGAITALPAGATDASSLAVGVDTGSAGRKAGSVQLILASNGAGTSGLPVLGLAAQTVAVSGEMFRLAAPNTLALEFGNLHVGDLAARGLGVTNTAAADGYSERLNAAFGAATDARIHTAGSLTRLAAGATDDSSLTVTLDTGSAGRVSGTVNVAFASDGAGTSGLGVTPLAAQDVAVTAGAGVYRYAGAAILDAQPIEFGAFRLGDAAGMRDLAIANTAANDDYSERLTARAGGASDGFAATGGVTLLAAGAVDVGGIRVGLETSVAGEKAGTAQVTFVSDGEGSSALGRTDLATQRIALRGRVYAPAVADLAIPAVDFGIVHVGDDVAARSVGVRNTATGALVDRLRGAIANVAPGFVAQGTLGADGLLAGDASDAFTLRLETTTAGVYSGAAEFVFASHDAELADRDLPAAAVQLHAQVNAYALPAFSLTGGDGTLLTTMAGLVLDFGTLTPGAVAGAVLRLANAAAGPADSLDADLAPAAAPFSLSGVERLTDLQAGDQRDFSVRFDGALGGSFEEVLHLTLSGHNASGYRAALVPLDLTLRARISAVPLPAGVWLFGAALAGLVRRPRCLASCPPRSSPPRSDTP